MPTRPVIVDGSALQLFVYGTLKRGHANHQRLCQGVRSIEDAAIEGRIYALAAGYPAVVIPEGNIRALGTSDPLADVATQHRSQRETSVAGSARPELRERPGGTLVSGEILVFDDPAQRLPAIDRLESFRPGRRSLYDRVLAPVWPAQGDEPILVWTYVMKDPGRNARLLPHGCWPE